MSTIITNVGPIRFEFQSILDENVFTAKAFQGENVVEYKTGTNKLKMLDKFMNMVKTEFMMRSDMPEVELLEELARMKQEEAA